MDDEDDLSPLISHICEETNKRKERIIQRIKVEHFVLQKLLQLPLFIAGSRADGNNDSSSDIDLSYLVPNILVVKERNETVLSNGQEILILKQDHCYPGYCKLEFSCETSRSAITGTDGFLSNSDFLASVKTLVPILLKNFGGTLRNLDNIHGPCVTPVHSFGRDDESEMDLAFCLKCNHWPDVANEWLDRNRPYGWPDADLLQRIRKSKCWFVPIGFSEEEEKRRIEWRISFSAAERALMWSLKPTQLLCIEFLKSFVSNNLESTFPNLICSYFLKTIMFWLFEEEEKNYWMFQNLTKCLNKSINKLTKCLILGYCPHYFVRSNNLFAKKSLQSLFTAGSLVQSLNINTQIIDFIKRKSCFYQKNCIFQNHIMVNTVAICRHFIHGFFENALKGMCAFIEEFSTDIDEMDRFVINRLKTAIASTFGSMLLSESPNNYQRAMVYIEEGRTSDTKYKRILETHKNPDKIIGKV